MPTDRISSLLQLVPDSPTTVLSALTTEPDLASASDSNGYSLVHAAASYNQLDLVRELVQHYKVDVNILDEEGETPLFAAETVETAKCLIEELGADVDILNEEGVGILENAKGNVEDGGEWVQVVHYLTGVLNTRQATNGTNGTSMTPNGSAQALAPGPLPPHPPYGVRIMNPRQVPVGLTPEQEAGEEESEPDPEFRRRIEELAAREDFQSEGAQMELKTLIEDAVGGLRSEEAEERNVRRRN